MPCSTAAIPSALVHKGDGGCLRSGVFLYRLKQIRQVGSVADLAQEFVQLRMLVCKRNVGVRKVQLLGKLFDANRAEDRMEHKFCLLINLR